IPPDTGRALPVIAWRTDHPSQLGELWRRVCVGPNPAAERPRAYQLHGLARAIRRILQGCLLCVGQFSGVAPSAVPGFQNPEIPGGGGISFRPSLALPL